MTLKVVYASTPEQDKKIQYLVDYFYTDLLPKYFCDDDITKFIKMNFLNASGKNELTGTLKESYQIISSLETIQSLIESNDLSKKQYQEMFNKNVQILNELGLSFPFSYEQFLNKTNKSLESGSIYVKPANSWLI